MILTKVQSKFNLQLSNIKTSKTIVFIDNKVPNFKQLIHGISPRIKVVLLNSYRDGIQQITESLRNNPNFSTVHIVSHGAPGCLYLGNSQLSLDTLAEYTQQLQSWFSLIKFSSLNPPKLGDLENYLNPLNSLDLHTSEEHSPQNWGVRGATLILYGCNVAAGDAGEEFIEKLHQITGAEIAASTTKTGHTSQGGNWNLDVKTSDIEATLAFNAQVQAQWTHILGNDNDGVPDNIDIDDDNDGILDINERDQFVPGTDLLNPGLYPTDTNLLTIQAPNDEATLPGFAPKGNNSFTFDARLTGTADWGFGVEIGSGFGLAEIFELQPMDTDFNGDLTE